MNISLKKILKDINYKIIFGKIKNTYISNICLNIKETKKNDLFICCKKKKIEEYIFSNRLYLLNKNINTIILERINIKKIKNLFNILNNINIIIVNNIIHKFNKIIKNIYGDIYKKIKIIGITGTNGKTSVVNMLNTILENLNVKTSIISTIDIIINKKIYKNNYTTPDVFTINKYIKYSIDQKCKYIFIEISSHSIKQHRIDGIKFTGLILTNISHDHLDYHKSLNEYINTKKKIFNNLDKSSFSLINIDEKFNKKFTVKNKSIIYKYSIIKKKSDFKIEIINSNIYRSIYKINNKYIITTKLLGKFNAYNILSVYATLIILGYNKFDIINSINKLDYINGRGELIKYKKYKIIIDYAHNPEGLKNILSVVNNNYIYNRIITIIGCGGNRDKLKRPIMGEIAYNNSDILILTSDNPRNEKIDDILNEMKKNIKNYKNSNKKIILKIYDRKLAIHYGLCISTKNDIIIIAGKGHEKYQEINNHLYKFNDLKIVKKYLYIK